MQTVSTTELAIVLKEFRRQLEALYGTRLRDVVLYGSWARGEATEDSDVDLLVVLSGEVSPGQEIDRMIDMLTQLNLDQGILVSVYPVSDHDYGSVNSPLLINARKEGVHI